jgi:hypothetical protein
MTRETEGKMEIVLKRTLNKKLRAWTGFNWLRMGSSGGLLTICH